ncbi:MAG TPA: EAL domain-containing protein [Burkholderiales bacterium]|nr:EAL domain-containing protein [Burkholderiales bacterium]
MSWSKPGIRAPRLSPALAVFLGGVALSLLCWRIAEDRVQLDAISKVDAAISDASDAIQDRLRSTYDVLYGVQGLFRASENVTREEFERYLTGLNLAERHPTIRTINFSRRVALAEKEAFVLRERGDRSLLTADYPEFAIKPQGERADYLPIVYIWPLAGNQNAYGLDLLSEERRESAERAIDQNRPVLSARLTLATDPTRQAAFSIRLPIYRRDAPIATVAERRTALIGMFSTTFLASALVGDVLSHAVLGPMAIHLYDRVQIDRAKRFGALDTAYLLYEKRPARSVEATDRHYVSRDVPIEIGGRRWQLRFQGLTHDYMTRTDRLLPWILLVGGLIVSALVAGLIRSLASARERAHTLAARITQDLRDSEAKLAEAQRLTQAMIEALPNPIFFKDTDGKYRGVNKAWETFFGIPRGAFIGKTVYDLYHADEALAGRMDALDQALWQRPGSQSYEAVIPVVDGMQRDVVYYKATYAGAEGDVVGLIGTIIDITERKQAERRQAMEHAVTRVLAEAQTLADAVPRIIRTVCETMGWHYGDRYEYDGEFEVLRRREMWCIDTPEISAFAESAAHRTIKPDATGTGLIRRTYAANKPVWIEDIAKDPGLRRKELVAQAGLHGAFAFPLVAANQVLGVMEFFHRDVREPDAMLIQIAESIGSQIGQFIVRMKAEEAVKYVAMHDTVTHLPNRVMFNQGLEQAIARAQRHERQLALMFIDLDRFKIINDTLGHEIGDVLLRDVAQRLKDNLRAGDMVARLGGDEFVVLLEDVEDAAAIGSVAEKLIAALSSNFIIAGREVHVTASIGLSTYPVDAQDMRSLMKYADIAMYRAKEQGRNTFQFYSDQINMHSVERLTLESQLQGALERDELVLHYQPVIDAKRGDIIGMEALVRWQHRDGDLLPPAKFIDIAEETGLIVPIGEWVLHTACMQQRQWLALGLPPIRIAVNLSPRQFVHRHFIEAIMKALENTQFEPKWLELELTETTVMHNAQRAIALLGELKQMGIRIAIDDFGTGYSSLAYLKRFPIDSLKIDRSFVGDVPHDPGNTAITQAIIAMAHSLGLKVTAEGVETAEQVAFLREHGCEEMQGYYFSRALPVAAATAILKRSAEAGVSSKIFRWKQAAA